MKESFKHALLNIMTLLQCNISPNKKINQKRITELVEFASLLIEYENCFKDKDIDFFLRETSISETLLMLEQIYNFDKHNNHIILHQPDSEDLIKTDSHYLMTSLKFIIEKLINKSCKVVLKYEEKEKVLIITTKPNNKIASHQKISLMELIELKNISKVDIAYELAFYILSKLGVKYKISKSKITLKF